jgi:hypothetical protein
MPISLQALQQRIDDLERQADEVFGLAEELRDGKPVQPQLSVKGQRWYRGARELLVQQGFSGLAEFEACYDSTQERGGRPWRNIDIGSYLDRMPDASGAIWGTAALAAEWFARFSRLFQKARALVTSVVGEALSRVLPMRAQLSFELSADEFQKAEEILAHWGGDEALLRASGVIARLALERHLFTLADTKAVKIIVNPPSKKDPGIEDVLVSLEKAGSITAIQKSQLDSLIKIGNLCAHPKERVTEADVRRLIAEGRQLASVLV